MLVYEAKEHLELSWGLISLLCKAKNNCDRSRMESMSTLLSASFQGILIGAMELGMVPWGQQSMLEVVELAS